MPYVNIQITREGTAEGRSAATEDEKRKLIQGVSQLLLEVLNKPLESTFVMIQEVDMENWGVGGINVKELRQRQKAGTA